MKILNEKLIGKDCCFKKEHKLIIIEINIIIFIKNTIIKIF